MNHVSKHKYIPVGGSITGRKHASETPYGYYFLIQTGEITKATRTDKKRRFAYALQEYSLLTGYITKTLHLKYSHTTGTLMRSNSTYYIKYGHIVLGKVIISLWTWFDTLKIDFEWFNRMDLRRYKSACHIHHNYQSYRNASEHDYNNLKNRNRRLNQYRRTK